MSIIIRYCSEGVRRCYLASDLIHLLDAARFLVKWSYRFGIMM